jgi:ankyrin repeat protein
MAAARSGSVDVARLLIHSGAEAEMTDTEGWTALVWASQSGNPEIAQLLLLADMDGAWRLSGRATNTVDY